MASKVDLALDDLERTVNQVIDDLVRCDSSQIVALISHQCECLNGLQRTDFTGEQMARLTAVQKKVRLEMKMIEQAWSVTDFFLKNLSTIRPFTATC